MVRVGFIVEGDSEKILVESAMFREWTLAHGITVTSPVVNARGGGNLLPENIEASIDQVRRGEPDHVVILTDLDDSPSVEDVRRRIGLNHTDLIFVAVKALEAWFLADSAALSHWLGKQVFEEWPERTARTPFERLKELSVIHGGRGPGSSKPMFARRYVTKHGFQLFNAAIHHNCPSATEFNDSLIALGKPAAAALQT